MYSNTSSYIYNLIEMIITEMYTKQKHNNTTRTAKKKKKSYNPQGRLHHAPRQVNGLV